MKTYHCQGGFIKVQETGIERSSFEQARLSGVELAIEIARRRARAKAIREHNRSMQGAL